MLKIQTNYPVVKDGKVLAHYTNADGVEYGPAPKNNGPLPGLGGAGYTPPSNAKSKSKQTAAQKAKKVTNKVGNIANKAGNVIDTLGNLFGKGNKSPSTSGGGSKPAPKPEAKKKIKPGIIVAGVIGVALLVTAVVLIVKKKK